MKSHLFKKCPEEAHKEDLKSRAPVEESISSTTQPQAIETSHEDLRKTFSSKPKAEDPEARWERKVKEFNSLAPYESVWGDTASKNGEVLFGYIQPENGMWLSATMTNRTCFPLPVSASELACFTVGSANQGHWVWDGGHKPDPRDPKMKEEVLDFLIRKRSSRDEQRSVGRLLRVGPARDANGNVPEVPVESNDRRMEEILDGLKSITHQWRG